MASYRGNEFPAMTSRAIERALSSDRDTITACQSLASFSDSEIDLPIRCNKLLDLPFPNQSPGGIVQHSVKNGLLAEGVTAQRRRIILNALSRSIQKKLTTCLCREFNSVEDHVRAVRKIRKHSLYEHGQVFHLAQDGHFDPTRVRDTQERNRSKGLVEVETGYFSLPQRPLLPFGLPNGPDVASASERADSQRQPQSAPTAIDPPLGGEAVERSENTKLDPALGAASDDGQDNTGGNLDDTTARKEEVGSSNSSQASSPSGSSYGLDPQLQKNLLKAKHPVVKCLYNLREKWRFEDRRITVARMYSNLERRFMGHSYVSRFTVKEKAIGSSHRKKRGKGQGDPEEASQDYSFDPGKFNMLRKKLRGRFGSNAERYNTKTVRQKINSRLEWLCLANLDKFPELYGLKWGGVG